MELTKKDIIIVLGVVCIGMVILNQYLSIIYKAELVFKPCELCKEQHPEYGICFADSYNSGWINITNLSSVFLSAKA